MTDKNNPGASPQPSEGRCEPTNLSHRYGSIGIDAVAAAVRYAGAGQNPAHAPVVSRVDQRFVEAAT